MLDRKIWDNIGGKRFCCFKKKLEMDTLCTKKYNLTGLCNEFSCPLANTKYATLREIDEELYLCIKEPERIHTPKDCYEKIKLPKDFDKAVEVLEKELKYWDKEIIHKCKQRLIKLLEYFQRLEYFKEHGRQEYMVRKKKMNRKEKLEALKALEDLDFEKNIGEELLLRLESGIYGTEAKDKYQNAREKYLEREKYKNRKKVFVADFGDNVQILEKVLEDDKKSKKKKSKKKQINE